jgi:hypothetical protein
MNENQETYRITIKIEGPGGALEMTLDAIPSEAAEATDYLAPLIAMYKSMVRTGSSPPLTFTPPPDTS